METTHVIRGGEWLPIYAITRFIVQRFWMDAPICHLPLLLKPVGNGKYQNATQIRFLYFH
jgi:glutamyl/glutaminyl-tRNA synthetase